MSHAGDMKHLNDETRYFSAALLAEMASRGRGIQTKLARQTDISSGLICDLKRGRTGGSPETREALANALDYSYEDFIAKGRKLEEENPRDWREFRASGRARRARRAGKASTAEESSLFVKNLSLKLRLKKAKRNESVLTYKLIAKHEELIAVQAKYILAQEESMRLLQEVMGQRWKGRASEGLSDPLLGLALTAPMVEAK